MKYPQTCSGKSPSNFYSKSLLEFFLRSCPNDLQGSFTRSCIRNFVMTPGSLLEISGIFPQDFFLFLLGILLGFFSWNSTRCLFIISNRNYYINSPRYFSIKLKYSHNIFHKVPLHNPRTPLGIAQGIPRNFPRIPQGFHQHFFFLETLKTLLITFPRNSRRNFQMKSSRIYLLEQNFLDIHL